MSEKNHPPFIVKTNVPTVGKRLGKLQEHDDLEIAQGFQIGRFQNSLKLFIQMKMGRFWKKKIKWIKSTILYPLQNLVPRRPYHFCVVIRIEVVREEKRVWISEPKSIPPNTWRSNEATFYL